MDREYCYRRTEDVEVDLMDLLRSFCVKWKQIAVCALAGALLLGGYGYLRNRSRQASGETVPEAIELTEEEQRGVTEAVQIAREVSGMEEYMENSILMQIDAYHKDRVLMLYCIDGASGQELAKITESYIAFLSNGGAAEAVKADQQFRDIKIKDAKARDTKARDTRNKSTEAKGTEIKGTESKDTEGKGAGTKDTEIGDTEGKGAGAKDTETGDIKAKDIKAKDIKAKDMETMYLAELFTVRQVAGSTPQVILDTSGAGEQRLLYLEVTGKDAEMAGQLAQALGRALKGYVPSVRKACGAHNLELLSDMASVVADNVLLTQQREGREQLKTGRTNLKAATDALDGKQKKAYEGEAGIGEKDEGTALTQGAGSGISLRYIVSGICGGVFAYGCVFLCLYLLRNVIRNEGEFKSCYTFPVYGCVPVRNTDGIRLPGFGGGGYEQKLAHALGRIRLACKKQDVKKLRLIAEFPAKGPQEEALERITGQLQKWGIQAETGKTPGSDVSQWDMEDIGTVLMVCGIGMTTYRMVDDAMDFYLENDVKVIGALLLDGR